MEAGAGAEEGAAVSEGRVGRLSATTVKKKDICQESVPKVGKGQLL